jgi:outer membrane protein
MPELDKPRANWALGVQVQVPLYRGKMMDHRMEEALAQQRAAEIRLNDLQQQIASEVRQASADLSTAQSKLALCAMQIQQAKAALDLANKRYSAGTGNNIEVLDAETAVAQAEMLEVQAVYACTVGKATMEYALGRKGLGSGL